MDVEFEATFANIDKNETRTKLVKAGGQLIKPEFLQMRSVFSLPKGNEIPGAWLRVRNESDKVTMSLKIVNGSKIEDQKEIYLVVNNAKAAEEFLETLGCKRKAFQESKRELWKLDDVEVTLDEWPFLEPFVEIEGKSEKSVKKACKKLNFNYEQAIFGAVDVLYAKKYNISKEQINEKTPLIKFNSKNPFE